MKHVYEIAKELLDKKSKKWDEESREKLKQIRKEMKQQGYNLSHEA